MARPAKKGTVKAAASRKARMARGKPGSVVRKTAANPRTSRTGQGAAKTNSRSAAMNPSRNELQSRLEKLERTNATLAAAQRNLQHTATETAERLSELQDKIDQLETKVAAFGAQRGSSPQGDEGRAVRDPGDAVPPRVGVAEPDEPSEEDRRVFEHMNEKLGPE
jgi:septal ring factor EnvC (AmiA/AmiB activator)